MASEITSLSGLTVSVGGLTAAASLSKVSDIAGGNFLSNVQTVGTTEEAIQVGDVTGECFIYIKNTDSTNFVQIALDSAVSTQIFAKLRAGEALQMHAKTATLYAKADTSPVDIQVIITEI